MAKKKVFQKAKQVHKKIKTTLVISHYKNEKGNEKLKKTWLHEPIEN